MADIIKLNGHRVGGQTRTSVNGIRDAVMRVYTIVGSEAPGAMVHALLYHAARLAATARELEDRRQEMFELSVRTLHKWFDEALYEQPAPLQQ
jgi:hypothetical protein